jgi:hypothetical protein
MRFFKKADAEDAPKPRNDAEASFWWYSRHAKQSRRLYRLSEVLVLVAGAMVPVSALLTDDAIAPAILGASIVVLTGLRTTFNWHDNWLRFTAACVALRTEDIRFEHKIEPYDRDDALDVLAMRVRAIEEAETQSWMVLRRQSATPQWAGGPADGE